MLLLKKMNFDKKSFCFIFTIKMQVVNNLYDICMNFFFLIVKREFVFV